MIDASVDSLSQVKHIYAERHRQVLPIGDPNTDLHMLQCRPLVLLRFSRSEVLSLHYVDPYQSTRKLCRHSKATDTLLLLF